MRLRNLLLLAVGTAALAACSSRSEDPQPVAQNPAPVAQNPAPPAASAETSDQQIYGSLEEELRAEVGDRVFFDFDSSSLRPDARQVIEAFATWLQQRPAVVTTIEGHADERGTRAYNLALGERRANAVKRYLNTLRVASDRVNTVSFGEERPAVIGSNKEAWDLNRRAQFQVAQ